MEEKQFNIHKQAMLLPSPEVPEQHFKTSFFVPAFMTFICWYMRSRKTYKSSSSKNLSTNPSLLRRALLCKMTPKILPKQNTERKPTERLLI